MGIIHRKQDGRYKPNKGDCLYINIDIHVYDCVGLIVVIRLLHHVKQGSVTSLFDPVVGP